MWPENQQPIRIFSSLSTQWRTGQSGPTGLDYNPLFTILGRLDLSAADYEQLFDDIRVVESEALTLLHKTK